MSEVFWFLSVATGNRLTMDKTMLSTRNTMATKRRILVVPSRFIEPLHMRLKIGICMYLILLDKRSVNSTDSYERQTAFIVYDK